MLPRSLKGFKQMMLTRKLEIDSLLVNKENLADLEGSILSIPKEGAIVSLPHPVISIMDISDIYGERPIPRDLDPEFFPKRPKIEYVKAPYFPVLEVDDSTALIEECYMLLNDIIDFQGTRVELQRAVLAFQTSLVQLKLAGKKGLLQRWVYGTRCSNSVRAVAAPSINITVNQVGVPEYACRKAKIEQGDWVLLSRSPVLHKGSVLLLQVVKVDGLAIRIHPLHNSGLGCDFDGDEIEIKKIEPCDSDIHTQLGACLNWAKWPTELSLAGESTEERTAPLEHTLGPEDMLQEDAPLLKVVKEAGGKVPADIPTYVQGCNPEEFKDVAYETTMDLAFMKVNIGKVGALTDVIAFILSNDESTLNLALQFKEHVTQTLLDSKHGADVMFDPDKILAMFNRQGKYKKLSNELIAEEASLMGVDKDLTHRLLNLISEEGIYNDIRQLPEIALSRGLSSMSSIANIYNGSRSPYGLATMIREVQDVFCKHQEVLSPRPEHREDQLSDLQI